MKKLLFVLTVCFACIGCDLLNTNTNADTGSGNAFPAAVHKSSDEAVDFYKSLLGSWKQGCFLLNLFGKIVFEFLEDSIVVQFGNGYIKVNDTSYPFSLHDDIYMRDEIDKNDSEYENFPFIYYIKLDGYDKKYFKIKDWKDGSLTLSSFDDYFKKVSDTDKTEK